MTYYEKGAFITFLIVLGCLIGLLFLLKSWLPEKVTVTYEITYVVFYSNNTDTVQQYIINIENSKNELVDIRTDTSRRGINFLYLNNRRIFKSTSSIKLLGYRKIATNKYP